MVFDDTARMLAVSWVLFEGFSKKEAARRLACNRATVQGWISAYIASGEWWPDPVLRNRHADNVIYDSHFLQAVNAVILSDPKQLIGEIKDVFAFLSTLPGYRASYKTSIGTLDRVLRATGFSYRKLYRMCRKRDQERRVAFARVMLSIPLRCIVSVDETHKDGGDVRRKRGRWLCGMRYDCLSRAEKNMLRTSTKMAVSYETGVIHCETTPTPPSQNSDDWLIFLAGLLPTMNKFVPGLPWALQAEKCVLLLDNAPIHKAEADAWIVAAGVFPLRLPPYSPDFQPIEEVFSELSSLLKTMHHSFPEEPDGLRHALAIISLSAANIGKHFDHCLLEAVRNVPELAGPEGPWRDAFEPLPMERE